MSDVCHPKYFNPENEQNMDINVQVNVLMFYYWTLLLLLHFLF